MLLSFRSAALLLLQLSLSHHRRGSSLSLATTAPSSGLSPTILNALPRFQLKRSQPTTVTAIATAMSFLEETMIAWSALTLSKMPSGVESSLLVVTCSTWGVLTLGLPRSLLVLFVVACQGRCLSTCGHVHFFYFKLTSAITLTVAILQIYTILVWLMWMILGLNV